MDINTVLIQNTYLCFALLFANMHLRRNIMPAAMFPIYLALCFIACTLNIIGQCTWYGYKGHIYTFEHLRV